MSRPSDLLPNRAGDAVAIERERNRLRLALVGVCRELRQILAPAMNHAEKNDAASRALDIISEVLK